MIYKSTVSVCVLYNSAVAALSLNTNNNNSNHYKSALNHFYKITEQFCHKKDTKTLFYNMLSSLFQFKS